MRSSEQSLISITASERRRANVVGGAARRNEKAPARGTQPGLASARIHSELATLTAANHTPTPLQAHDSKMKTPAKLSPVAGA